MLLSGIVAALLLVSVVVTGVGVVLRVVQWLATPQPWPVPLTPAPTTRTGAAFRLLREAVLFQSLLRASPWTWVFGWGFHFALLLAFFGHLRFATEPLWPALPDTRWLATGVGVLMLASLAGLAGRRLLVERVRRISLPSDHLMLALLAGVAISGLAMGDYAGYALRDFLWGLARLELRPLPVDVAAVAHLLLVSALLLVLPFSKLLHGVALFFNPTRYQPDRARLPAAGERAGPR